MLSFFHHRWISLPIQYWFRQSQQFIKMFPLLQSISTISVISFFFNDCAYIAIIFQEHQVIFLSLKYQLSDPSWNLIPLKCFYVPLMLSSVVCYYSFVSLLSWLLNNLEGAQNNADHSNFCKHCHWAMLVAVLCF